MTAGAPRIVDYRFVLAFLANFLHALAFHSYLHLPGFVQSLGASEVEIGAVMGALSAFAIVARPLVGRIMDTRGRRVILLAGGLVHVVACLAYLTVHRTGPWLYAVRGFHGLAMAMLFSVLFTMAADLVPDARRTQGIALFGISGMLPLSLAGLVGDAVLANGDYGRLFVWTAVAACAGLAVSLPLPDSRPKPLAGEPAARSFLAAIATPSLVPLWLAGVAFAAGIASYVAFLKTYLAGAGVGRVGLFFTAYTLAAVGLRLFLGWLPDRIGATRVLLPALVFMAAGLAVLATGTDAVTVAVAGTMCGLGHGFAFPVLSALVVDRSRPSERGTSLSFFTALFDLGVLVGGPSLGLVIELSDYPTMYVTAASTVMAGLVVFVVLERRLRPTGSHRGGSPPPPDAVPDA